jgi:hypothetical protein
VFLIDWLFGTGDPTTILDWFAVLPFTLVMYIGGFVVCAGVAELLTRRHFIPYKTVHEWVSEIAGKKHSYYVDSLRRQDRVAVAHFVRQVVADEFGEVVDSVGDEYVITR